MGEGHLEQVLDNLIANALDALSAGGHVTVTATATAAGARITVADDGPGMSAEDRERAFLRFTTSNPNGTGLGLAIVHRLVTSNGGTARLAETPGGGLTAILDFPASAKHRAEQHGRGVPFVRAGPRQPVVVAALYEGTKDPARKARVYVCQARSAIMIRVPIRQRASQIAACPLPSGDHQA